MLCILLLSCVDKQFDDEVFRVPAHPTGTPRAITKSPNKAKFNENAMPSSMQPSLSGSMPPPFSLFENSLRAEIPSTLRSITKRPDVVVAQQDQSPFNSIVNSSKFR